MLTATEQVIRATGSGKTRMEALQDALNAMRKQVMQEREEAILHMEPTEIAVVRAVRHARTERFFGLLFPKEQVRYELTVDITVAMRLVDVAAIPFANRQESLSLAKHVLEMR